MKNNPAPNNCFYCPDKWKCYDRVFKGRQNPCTAEERKINKINYKWFELYSETPDDRSFNKRAYIDICRACWKKQEEK